MKLFARAKKAPAPKESMAKLRETLDMLEKREAYLQKKVEKELLVAKQNATKNKRAALAALKRKKTYESQMEKMAGARATIETQVMAIENASVSLEAMNAMRQGAEAMKTIHRNMTIEDVDNTMEEIREQMDLANEISDAIAQPLGDQYDEDELQAELAALEEEALDEQFLGSKPALDSLPAVPSAAPAAPAAVPAAKAAASAASDDAEFRALAEGMAM